MATKTITGPHKEPEELGGATYYRCEECGSESVFGRESILHRAGCPAGEQ